MSANTVVDQKELELLRRFYRLASSCQTFGFSKEASRLDNPFIQRWLANTTKAHVELDDFYEEQEWLEECK